MTKNNLFSAYCSSHYGAELWDLDCSALDVYGAAWRTGLRRIWQLPCNSHGHLVALMSMTAPLLDTIRQRFVNFIIGCINSPSALVVSIVQHSLLDLKMASYIGRNLFLCSNFFQCDVSSLLSTRITARLIQQHFTRRITAADYWAARAAVELVFVREGFLQLNDFTADDIHCFLPLLIC